MADIAKIKRNIGRMVEQSAPEADIDEYIKSEGVTIEQVRSFKEQKPAGDGFGMKALRQGLDSLTFGFNDKAASALYAAGQQITGSPRSFSEDYNAAYGRAAERQKEASKDAIPAIVGKTAGMIAQGVALLPRQAAIASYEYAKEAVKPAQSLLATWAEGLPSAARYGAAYGSADAAGHSSGPVQNQLMQVLEGTAGGAVMGPAVHTGFFGLGAGLAARQRSVEARRNAVAANVDEARSVGITDPLGPAMSNSGVQQNAARAVGAGIGGKPIGDRAAADIAQLEASLSRRLAELLDGKEAGDLGKSVQQDLRRALVGRSRSSDDVSRMSREDMEAVVGPVGEGGFLAPRPDVKAISPRQIEPISPRDVGPEPARPVVSMPDAAAFSRRIAELERKIAAEVAAHNAQVQGYEAAFQKHKPTYDKLAELQKQADALATQYRDLSSSRYINRRNPGETVPQYHARVSGLAEQHNKIIAQINAMAPEVRAAETALSRYGSPETRVQAIRELHARRDQFEASLTAARAQEAKSRVEYDEALKNWQQRRTQSIADAEAETAALRQRAQTEADEATRIARIASDRKYQDDLASGGNAFSPGRSAESYPTEFDVAYRLIDQAAPKGSFNPLGDGYSKTKTFKLLFDEAMDAKRTLKIDGKLGDIMGSNGFEPAFRNYLRARIGNGLTRRLDEMASRRGQAAISQDATRKLYSDLGRAAREAERPQFPAQPRPEDAALMRRLQGALKDDFYANLSSRGRSPRFSTQTADYETLPAGRGTSRSGMPPSDETYYLQPSHVEKLNRGPIEADKISRTLPIENIQPERHPTRGDLVGRYSNVKSEYDRSTVVPQNRHPDAGLVPVEVWDGGNRLRVGTPIASRAPTEGERAVAMFRNVDEGYRQYVEDLRKPLSKIFGDNVEPVQALERLGKAAMKGETSIIAAYGRVMREKAAPQKGAAALIHHLSGGGNMQRFQEMWRDMPEVSKKALFQGEGGEALRNELTRYFKVGERYEKFVNAAKVRPVVDPTRITHLLTVSAAYANLPAVIAMVGGNAVAARVMSSPRYLRWISDFPDAARGGFDTARFSKHLERLGGLAGGHDASDAQLIRKALSLAISQKGQRQ